jgi:enoyl-CoA hydratase
MATYYEKKGHVVTLRMSTPNGMNTYGPDEIVELNACLQKYVDDPDAWVAILTGEGEKAFTAGGDLKRHNKKFDDQFAEGPRMRSVWYPKGEPGNDDEIPAWYAWASHPDVFKPMIAAVNGYCLGFGLILLTQMTDYRIAAEHAKFGFTEHKRGFGGSSGPRTRILNQIPYAIAMELLLFGDMIDAKRAYEVGLVNEVVPLDQLMARADDAARRLCEMPPVTVRAVKESALRSFRGEIPEHLTEHYLSLLGAVVKASPDVMEGVSAWAEKREPNFTGR